MKINSILTEAFGGEAGFGGPDASAPQGPGMAGAGGPPAIKFKDLNTLQVRTLQRLADGQVDVDSAKDSEYDIMTDLAELGLLDQEYQLTKAGQKAVAIAKQLGGSSELLAAKRKQQSMDNFDRTGGAGAGIEDDTTDIGVDDIAGEPTEEDEFDFSLDAGRGRGAL